MFKKFFPILIIIFVVGIVFRKFFLQGLLPIPGDLLIGAYYPWLDFKWGFSVAVPVKNPLPSDVISLLYPWRILGMEIIKNGQLPLWDPTILLGTPLLANFQAALLNPFNILFLIFSPPIAWSIQVILQPFFIALAMYLFLKNLGVGKLAAVFGGLSFAFSGFSLVWMEYNTIGFALAYFPLTLFLVDKIIQTKKIIFAFFLGLALAGQIFSGYPQISIYTIIFASLYFTFRLYQTEDKVKKSLVVFLGLINAALFAAVQLLPSYELLQLSIRGVDNTAANAGIQFLPLTHLITLLIPDFFGHPVTANYWLGSYDNFAFFLPAVTVFLSFFALKKKNIIFLIFAFLSLMLAIDNPLSQLVSQSNLLGLKSAVATRVLFVFDFALAVLAAYGFNELILKKKLKLKTIFLPTLIILGCIFLGLLTVKLFSDQHFSTSLRNSFWPVLIIVLLVASLLVNRFHVLFIFALLVLNIVLSTDKYLSFISPNLLFPQTEAITTLQNNLQGSRFDKEKGEIFSSNTWIPYNLKAASGQNAIYPLSTSKYLSLVNGYYPNYLFRFVDVTGTNSPLYDTLDIKYFTVLKRRSAQFNNPKFKEFKEIGSMKILENTSNLGFAWFSKNVKCVQNEKETAEVLKQKNYDPKELMVVGCQQEIKDAERGEVKIIADIPGNLKFQINNPIENYLHLSQASYPGWQAFLDEQKTPIFTSNLALTAVKVPPGNHTLELKYQPQTFTLGWKISLGTLTLWIVYLGLFKILKRPNNV